MDYYKTFWDLNHLEISITYNMSKETSPKAADVHHTMMLPGHVAGEPRAGAELLLGHVGQEPEVLP